MSETPLSHDEPIRRAEDLLAVFRDAEKPPAQWRVGAEMEKFGVFVDSGAPLQYEGERGVVRFLTELTRAGWHPERETESGPVIALLRESSSITLEPGSQLELSGAPLDSVHAICAEFRHHLDEIAPLSRELKIQWLGLGFHPFARREELSFVPKTRYGIMKSYLPTRGGHALDMMLRTSTVQANFDYESERDALRKLRVALKLAPLTTAIFANSPFYEGAPHGGLTYRGRVWLDVDPDRTGLLPAIWKENATYEDYVQWALDAPMFVVKRPSGIFANTGQTFRSFWKDGARGEHATQADWQLHLNTLFPEVRLKKTIEIRGADAQGNAERCALPAMWTGILYDERALAQAEAITQDFEPGEVEAVRADVASRGIRAHFRGKTMVELAQRVLEIAEGGLERRARKRSDGKDERIHLAGIKALVARGQTPADRLLEGLGGVADPKREIIARAGLIKA